MIQVKNEFLKILPNVFLSCSPYSEVYKGQNKFKLSNRSPTTHVVKLGLNCVVYFLHIRAGTVSMLLNRDRFVTDQNCTGIAERRLRTPFAQYRIKALQIPPLSTRCRITGRPPTFSQHVLQLS